MQVAAGLRLGLQHQHPLPGASTCSPQRPTSPPAMLAMKETYLVKGSGRARAESLKLGLGHISVFLQVRAGDARAAAQD